MRFRREWSFAIRRELLSADYRLVTRSSSWQVDDRTAFPAFAAAPETSAGFYIGIIVTDREQCFLHRDCTEFPCLPPPPPPYYRRASGPLRRFTISNYNDYVDLLRGELSFLSAPCPISQKGGQRRENRVDHRRGSDVVVLRRAIRLNRGGLKILITCYNTKFFEMSTNLNLKLSAQKCAEFTIPTAVTNDK